MSLDPRHISFFLLLFALLHCEAVGQILLPSKLPDTGQNTHYTTTPGEDADFIINPPTFTDNGDGTITDNNTGLMWQKTDGGEMTFETASACQQVPSRTVCVPPGKRPHTPNVYDSRKSWYRGR